MKKYHLFIFILILSFSNKFGFSQTLNIELSDLNIIRKNHFELGDNLDIIKLNKYKKSKNTVCIKLSYMILFIYDIENSRPSSDKRLIDFVMNNKWLLDSLSKNLELLIIDDLFRVCMSLQRYRLFQFANLAFFENKYNDILSWSYENYIYLKTGNLYSFLNIQNIIKNHVTVNIDEYYSQYSPDVFNRLKLNLMSIRLANYDTLGLNSFHQNLIKYANLNLDSTSAIEDIIYTQELSNLGVLKGFDDHNLILRNKIWSDYIPPFILNLVYYNLDWPNETRRIIKKLFIINKYNKATQIINNLDFYAKDFLDYKIKSNKYYFSFGNFDNETLSTDESNSEIPKEVNYIDSISSTYVYIEPNWLELKLQQIIKGQSNSNLIDYDLEARRNIENGKNFSVTGLTALRLKELKLLKIFDPTKIIDCSNIFYSPFMFLDYFNHHENKILTYDTTMYPLYDSVYNSLLFFKNTHYLSSLEFSNEKYLFYSGIINTITVLKEIMLSAKQYDKYELLCQVDDISDKMKDSIPENLKIINDKYRYLTFKANATSYDLKIFDSLFLHQINKYITSPNTDTATLQNRFYFHQDISRNILIDLHNRKSLSDSLLINYFSYLEAVNQISKRVAKDLPVYNQTEDTVQAINIYKNDYFCINNSEIKLKKSNSDTLFYKFINNSLKFKNGNLLMDSNQNVIWYFVSENYDVKKNKDDGLLNFSNTSLDLYVAYSNPITNFVKKLISIDSLGKIIDLNSTKSNQFFSGTYFNEINNKSKTLYDILLKPVEEYILPNLKFKIVLPSLLLSLPLDYLYAREQKVLPHFIEYSDITSTIYNNGILNFQDSDSAVVFSEMSYNNIYCNINKSYTPLFRSGISELKHSKIEREGINKSFNVKSFTGLNASKLNFISTLIDNRYKNIHLITHGVYIPYNKDEFTNDSGDNGISTAYKYLKIYGISRAPAERQLLLFSSDSLNHTDKNNLLVSYELKYLDNLSHINCIFLSACETGLIDDVESNTSGYSGFVKEFLDRGVKSVIATRWKIQDNLAADFAIKFYENLKKYKEYSEAFYNTKLTYYLNNKNPFIWTSYVFVQ